MQSVKSFLNHKLCRSSLIFMSLAFSQTPAYTVKLEIIDAGVVDITVCAYPWRDSQTKGDVRRTTKSADFCGRGLVAQQNR